MSAKDRYERRIAKQKIRKEMGRNRVILNDWDELAKVHELFTNKSDDDNGDVIEGEVIGDTVITDNEVVIIKPCDIDSISSNPVLEIMKINPMRIYFQLDKCVQHFITGIDPITGNAPKTPCKAHSEVKEQTIDFSMDEVYKACNGLLRLFIKTGKFVNSLNY